jgi:hypothetical protein
MARQITMTTVFVRFSDMAQVVAREAAFSRFDLSRTEDTVDGMATTRISA